MLNKKVLNLVHDIQDLAMQINDIHIYYQQNIQLFQVYRIKDHKHTFQESVYLDEEKNIEKLERIKTNIKKLVEREEHYEQFRKNG